MPALFAEVNVNIKKIIPVLLLAALAACSYKPPEDLVLKIFEKHSFIEQDPAKIKALLKERGPAGLKQLDIYAEVVNAPRTVKQAAKPPVSPGLLIGPSGDGFRVLRAFNDGPAAEAGLKDGDKLAAADGALPGTPAFLEALSKKEFALKVSRHAKEGVSELEAKVAAAPFGFPVIFGFYEPETRTAVIKVRLFLGDAAPMLAAGLAGMEKYGAKNVLFDLRGNKGGNPADAAAILDLVAEKAGPVFALTSRHKGYSTVFEAKGRGRFAGLRPAVLVDGETAMAGEVFAASLKELRGAKVIGARTAGAVWLQNTFRLTNGRGLKLTIAELTPPSGADLEGKGVTPDEVVALSGEQAAGVKAAWAAASPLVLLEDPAYAKALELFKK